MPFTKTVQVARPSLTKFFRVDLKMSFLSRLFGRGDDPSVPPVDVSIDLTRFRCNTTALGAPPTPSDGIAQSLNKEGVFKDPTRGIEIGLEDGRLDYVFLTMSRFDGRLLANERELAIHSASCLDDVLKLFGEPYCLHEDDDEVILFYEDGRVELQFEFPGKVRLGLITLMLSPVLADAEQRKSYGVTKPWPPAGKIHVRD
ncbi:MAG: hypothetical protein AAF517_02270 [Planctomycetota bacterium]